MSHPAAKRGKAVSVAEFAKLWCDHSLTCAQIGARLGISSQSVSERAKRRGLPPRIRGRAKMLSGYDTDLFRRMFLAGVRRADMAAYFQMAEVTVRLHARRAGLVSGWPVVRPITLRDFFEAELGHRMAETADRRSA